MTSDGHSTSFGVLGSIPSSNIIFLKTSLKLVLSALHCNFNHLEQLSLTTAVGTTQECNPIAEVIGYWGYWFNRTVVCYGHMQPKRSRWNLSVPSISFSHPLPNRKI